ncbi:AI-2E family transporter [Sanguibacter hominis ATCC BAA-789]|uniref:AI-2E family transporter n=1 Tax=Sanguibacter hominis ATCC BAA-789 TaxID=1312740 RepID=A0A9X5FFZ0_9MICO|nr:AI-2E family transporter [Sanguibacter hominis ATCC BAA-789]
MVERRDAPTAAGAEFRAADTIPPVIQSAAAWTWRLLVVGLGVAAAIWLVKTFSPLLIPIAVALLFTVLLAPLVKTLQVHLRFPRALAAAVGVIGLIAVIFGLVFIAGRSIVTGFANLSTQASEGLNQAIDWLSTGPLELDVQRLDEAIETATTTIEDNLGTILAGAASVTATVTGVLTGTVIALFCTFFFLLDGRAIWTWVVGLLPRQARQQVHQAGRRGLVTLAAYTRTQILVAAVDATGIGVGAAILGLPLALPLGILVFVGSFIPFVGALVTGAMAVLVALVVKGWVTAVIMLVIVLAVQQIEGNVLQPFLMGHAVALHPVAVLLVVTGGTMYAGIVGALFAVPVAAVLNTVLLFFHGHDKFPDLGIDDRLTVRPTAEAELRARARALRRGADDGPNYSAADEDDAEAASRKGEL